jgi:hypothetical protein
MLLFILITALAMGDARSIVVVCSEPTVPMRSQAEYLPGVPGKTPPALWVTFNKTRPSSQQAEAVLRACILALTKTIRVDEEMIAEAWYNSAAAGTTDRDELLPLPDGSRHLSFDPKTGRVQTWNKREGIRSSTREDPKGQYFIEYTEKKRAVPPHDKFASIDVIFATPPAEAAIYATLVAEIKRVVQAQTTKLDTTAFAKTGPRGNRAEQHGVRGGNGKFILIYFDPKNGTIRSFDGKILGSLP